MNAPSPPNAFDRLAYMVCGFCRVLGFLCLIVAGLAFMFDMPVWPAIKAALYMYIFGYLPAVATIIATIVAQGADR